MKETAERREAFHKYCVMEQRSYRTLAKEVGVGASTITAWAREFNWEARVDIFDKETAGALRNKLLTDWTEMRLALLNVLMDQIDAATKAKVRPTTTRDMVAAIREIRSMVGDVAEDKSNREGIEYVRTITNDETSDSDTDI